MNTNERRNKASVETQYAPDVSVIAERLALDDPRMKEAVVAAPSKVGAIATIRTILRKEPYAEEIAQLPAPTKEVTPESQQAWEEGKTVRPPTMGFSPASNEFMIAKYITELLWHDRSEKETL